MKIGTVITGFNNNWQTVYKPLRRLDFDHFEFLPENQDVYSAEDVQEYFKGREVIVHAPFGQANLVAPSKYIREGSRKYLSEVFEPLEKSLKPAVITTHLGKIGEFYEKPSLDSFNSLYNKYPCITFENLPHHGSFWSVSHPYSKKQIEYILHSTKADMTFDVGHWGTQGLNVYEFVEEFHDRIRDIHLHDFVNDDDHLPLGKGGLDVKKFMETLKKINYNYYLTLELGFEDTQKTIDSFEMVKKLR